MYHTRMCKGGVLGDKFWSRDKIKVSGNTHTNFPVFCSVKKSISTYLFRFNLNGEKNGKVRDWLARLGFRRLTSVQHGSKNKNYKKTYSIVF